ncbi:hypothetical protein LIT25_26415 (plasmid) [Bacillus sp. F19]|nr:hypothetical protein LIT25_26415 [Bacillus sp. F19]
MYVRIVVFLPLLFLLAVFMPSMAFAENGVNQTEVNGKDVQKANVQKVDVQKADVQKANVQQSTKINDISDKAKEQSSNVNKSKNVNASVKNQGKPNDLPDQANDKAKEAVHKVVQNQEKEKKPDPSPQKRKGTDSLSQKGEKTKKRNLLPIKEPVSDRNKEPHYVEEVYSNNESNSNTEKVESTISNNVSKEVESSKEELPIPLPNKKVWELHIFQVQQSIKTPFGLSNDYKGSNKIKMDFLNDYTGQLGVRFKEPFVLRQHVYRNQWVNAPPAPPPKFALSFLSTI